MPALLQRALTFSLVSVGWLLFLFDFSGISQILDSFIGLNPATQPAPSLEMWVILGLAMLVAFGIRFETWAENNSPTPWKVAAANIGFAVLFIAVLLFLDRSQTFIYFRF